jgi:hypothetical protein
LFFRKCLEGGEISWLFLKEGLLLFFSNNLFRGVCVMLTAPHGLGLRVRRELGTDACCFLIGPRTRFRSYLYMGSMMKDSRVQFSETRGGYIARLSRDTSNPGYTAWSKTLGPEKWRRLTLGQIVDPTIYRYGHARWYSRGEHARCTDFASPSRFQPFLMASPSFPLSNQQRGGHVVFSTRPIRKQLLLLPRFWNIYF